ncbi:ectoine utilization protein EutA [Paracoccus sp. R12_1]|jgi:maleate isomerase|uniref:maleate cis-trans isomerase family protein n=1 Tax=unclassified Paracoccus (in: a-proteobacteria) TaxID=2688777 RepID=UPI000C0B65C8|nr:MULTISPECIES: ectoine utilization protein EutA [unclassified Paracoccus (in: a-proteobacteria)]MBO9455664.1 ectoine utilization protein EutA [Paracoccus sp. R12_2]MBO9486334.1 ectoine utilization protein EutA [Paracoccus sp. R12_1]PHQ71540.1 MAG: ectoine utilization protein EutA [Paracoccus sp. (in: a-proteobacteria)]
MWRDNLNRFGLIALATDLTIEGDALRLLPQDCRLHVTRIAFDNPTTAENLKKTGPHLKAASDLLVPGVELKGIGFGCTSASAVLGDGVQTAIGDRAPISTPVAAALRGFKALGVDRIALMTPYLRETTDLVGDHFEANGLGVVSRQSMGHADDRDMALLSGDEIVDFALESDHPDAQALFMSCTALPAVSVIERIEKALGKPVVSSNLALFWSMLDVARIPAAGPGKLFQVRTW